MENESSILIASNELFTRKMLQKTLIKGGNEVVSASNGQEALQILKENFYPIIITDMRMPAMDGIKLCRKIRKLQFRNHIYIIILTANPEKENIKDLLDAGVDDYLIKPFNQTQIIYCVKNIMTNRKGVIYAGLGLDQEIIRSHEEFEKINPNNPDIHYNLGLTHYQLEHYEETIKSFKRCIELRPHWTDAYYNVGDAQYKLGLYEDAVESYECAIELNSDDAITFYKLGLAQDKLGKTKNAKVSFKIYLCLTNHESLENQQFISHAKKYLNVLRAVPCTKKEPRRKNILIVDCDELLRNMIKELLTHEGYNVTTAEDALDGLVKLEEKGKYFDLIITALMIPGMDGVEMIRTLHKDLKMKIPAFLMASLLDGKTFKYVFEEGLISDWIPKPFKISDLLHRVRLVFSNVLHIV